MKDRCFIPFKTTFDSSLIPNEINDPFGSETPEICKIAALELQDFIMENQGDWLHNFGLGKNKTGKIRGKMFGVLVVEDSEKGMGYLCTFSGKIKDHPHPIEFVPALFDIYTKDNFLSKGMIELTETSNRIKLLEKEDKPDSKVVVEKLKNDRRIHSILLQEKLFGQYHFLNQSGKQKSLNDIFRDYDNRKPAAGAGECAAPKLLQYAFERKMKPLAIAEFWWGKSTKSEDRKHREFYPACNDKCRPILNYMLGK